MKKASILKFLGTLAIPFILAACLDNSGDGFDPQEQFDNDLEAIDQYIEENSLDAKIDSGSQIRYVIHTEGNDTTAVAGDTLDVHYTGYLLNGTKFDSSVGDAQPFTFILGARQVISGWDIAFSFLEEESEATIFLPSFYAYGRTGSGNGAIPPNTPIFFEVELLNIRGK